VQSFGHHDFTMTYSLLFLPACLFPHSLSCFLPFFYSCAWLLHVFVGSCGGSCGCNQWFFLQWLVILVVAAAAVGGVWCC